MIKKKIRVEIDLEQIERLAQFQLFEVLKLCNDERGKREFYNFDKT